MLMQGMSGTSGTYEKRTYLVYLKLYNYKTNKCLRVNNSLR